MTTPLMREYFDEVRKLRDEFREEVIVLMQVGSFYEIYEIEGCGHAKLVAGILGYQLTKKNSKLPACDENPWLCGFPLYNLGKLISKMNDEGYTVAVYDQRVENVKERYRRGVYSPSIRLDTDDKTDVEKRLFSIRLEAYRCGLQRYKPFRFLFSVIFIDMDTGKILMKEYDSEDWLTMLQFIHLRFSPNEILLRTIGDFPFRFDDLPSSKYHFLEEIDQDPTLLLEVFDINDPIVDLSLERHPGLLSALMDLVTFVRKHDPCLLKRLNPPIWSDDSPNMEYNRDAFIEFNIMDICTRRRSHVDKSKQKTVFDVLNHTWSPMGKRRLRDVLRSPIVDIDTLQQRLKKISGYQDPVASSYHKPLRDLLTSLPDIDWLLFKWQRGQITLRSAAIFLQNLRNLGDFLSTTDFHDIPIQDVGDFLNRTDVLWDLEALLEESYGAIKNPSTELQRDIQMLQELMQQIHDIEQRVNFAKDNSFKLVRMDHLYYFQTTKKRWDTVKTSPLFQEFSSNVMSSVCRFFSPTMHSLSRKIKILEDRIQRMVHEQFRQESDGLFCESDTLRILTAFSNHVADLDYQYSVAQFFKESHYVCPELHSQDTSMVRAEALRHVIIENIDRDRLFVPQSAQIGNDHLGVLIFGMNSSGKSTYLKSLGISIWLAQCGLFVPAQRFCLAPFHALMTKIGVYDNLYAGHSTFIAEMNELHYMFRKAIPKRTLIMCDELTAGTEILSAVGIVSSTIRYFLEKQIAHLMTTHLHLVAEIPDIKNDRRIRIHHFEVQSEKTDSLLIHDLKIRYNRQLKDGSGASSYGIEIANDMGLPKEFISRAYDIRANVLVEWKAKKKVRRSRYNKKLWMTKCIHCGSQERLHTHHITPQAVFANDPQPAARDGLYNIIVLCEECHEDLHHARE